MKTEQELLLVCFGDSRDDR